MLTRILILMLLININGFSQKKIPVKITRSFNSLEANGIVFINVKLFNGGKELINKDFDALNDSSLISMYDTITINSNSKLLCEITYANSPLTDRDKIIYKNDSLEFNLNGNELRLSLYFLFGIEDELYRTMTGMTVSTLYDGNDLAKLIFNSKPLYPSKYLSFNIINTSQQEIYGNGSFGKHFWSNIFVYKNGEWVEPKMFIAMCGNIGYEPPLKPGDTTNADVQGLIITSDGIPITRYNHPDDHPNKYRVISTFSTEPKGIPIEDSPVFKCMYTFYQSSLEFEIK
ncbi:MAG: hypothetical protein KDC73_07060 [Ignavibacteriae bacterium]|nr:hypothetical protein [Ignavibacteriota bacterium]MCB9244613.1 hypothetical protein [Ignavibacteriales bacterium]